jgi:cyclohexanecarboxylate-CoA ligase
MFETTLTGPRVRNHIEAGHWSDRTLFDDVLLHGGRTPSRVAVVDSHGEYTYAQLVAESGRVASSLLNAGVRRGDVVAVQLPNWREFVAIVLGVERIGAAVAPLAPALRTRELHQVCSIARPKVMVVPCSFRGRDYLQSALAVQEMSGSPELIVTVRGSGAGSESWDDFCLRGAGVPGDVLPYVAPAVTDIAELAFTSGTTGEPKGVMHTHGSAVCAVVSTARRQRLGPDDVFHVAATVGHNAGYFYGVRLALHAGGRLVLQDEWGPEQMLDLVRRYRVTYTFGAPTHLVDLLASPGATPESLKTLRLYICAGAPVPRALAQSALDVMPQAFCRVFGMTELGHATSTESTDEAQKLLTTDGSPQPEMRVRITDADGRRLPAGTEGQVEFAGPFLFAGYIQGREFTEQWFDGEWFQTGDLGVVDGDGYLRITGREKDIIVRAGENIPVREIEELLATHDKIAEVALVGTVDERLGEQAVAFIRLKSDADSLTLADLQAFFDGTGVMKQYWPERVMFVSEFPRSPSGKIKKNELRTIVVEHGLEVAPMATKPATARRDR